MLRRILIIDDSDEVRDLVKYCTARPWPDVEIVLYHPNKGMPKQDFGWQDYDLVILDYQLGLSGEDGLDWLKTMKRYAGISPILFMTAHSSVDNAVKAMKFGAANYLNKEELTPKKFTECIEEILKDQGQDTKQIYTEGKQEKEQKAEPQVEFEKTVLIDPKELGQSTGSPQQAEPGKEETLLFAPESEMSTDVALSKTGTTGHSVDQVASSNGQGDAIVVPGYNILKKVGEGGMASIFLAESAEENRQVILKVLYIMNDESRQMLKRFIREYRLIGQLDHPNIAKIYERAFASNFAYIAMEYCPSGDLSARLDKALPPETAVEYMRQIAAGIGAAHKLGIIHRDMKPGNILFREDDTIAITDFGIAKTMGEESELTMVGSIVGTLLYLSPEQIRGSDVMACSDLYSLGVIFYKMLTGEYPFMGKNVEQVINAHLSAHIPKLPPEISSFQPIIDGLLAKDPSERFQSAEEFIVGLEWS